MTTGETPEDRRDTAPMEAELGTAHLRRLIQLGIALSAERNHDRLAERILLEARDITNADGGTLYLVDPGGRTLHFKIVCNESLNIRMGGTSGREISFPALNLYDPITGQPNHNNIATYCALTRQTVNIEDAYTAEGFDFSGTKRFDAGTGYRSKSFLTIPLLNYSGAVTGVLQLINARVTDGTVVPFSPTLQPLVEALASQAAVALDNQQLIQAQRDLMDKFIQVLAETIDSKSPYTGGHCRRVPILAEMLARAACDQTSGPFAGFDLSDEEWHELEVGAWLHDCGKVTTPEYVMDKATKLETITDRIHEVRTRFEVLRRDAEIDMLRRILAGEDKAAAEAAFAARCAELDDDFAFIAQCNVGREFMPMEHVARLARLSQTSWTRYFDRTLGLSWEEGERLKADPPPPAPAREPLLADRHDHLVGPYNRGELYNLSIQRGTLTDEERKVINDHIVVTQNMLQRLPFPRQLSQVPAIAGNHHEKINGAGFPKGLTGDEMSVREKIMAIADVFEALSAADRPYKSPKPMSECLRIMGFMASDGHIDRDLFELFIEAGVYKEYAELCLRPDQDDTVDVAKILGRPPRSSAAE